MAGGDTVGVWYRQFNWERVLAADPDMVIINSFNEYGEETALAPADTRHSLGEKWYNPQGEIDAEAHVVHVRAHRLSDRHHGRPPCLALELPALSAGQTAARDELHHARELPLIEERPVQAADVDDDPALVAEVFAIHQHVAGRTAPVADRTLRKRVRSLHGWNGGAHHLTLLEQRKSWRPFVPSPTGVGIAMLIPISAVTVIFLGAALDAIWARVSPASHARYSIPIASGLIAGEALVAVAIPPLVTFGLMRLP